VVLDLPASPRAASAARRAVGATLRSWRLEVLCADAELVVSELVTNAVIHAPGPTSRQLRIVRRDAGVRLVVSDGSPSPPSIRTLNDGRSGGRGLRIVATLASAWGYDRHADGKQVWADLDLPTATQPT
jgi:anti-sigma regulatory factor (Ser/Thr protein kinase)